MRSGMPDASELAALTDEFACGASVNGWIEARDERGEDGASEPGIDWRTRCCA